MLASALLSAVLLVAAASSASAWHWENSTWLNISPPDVPMSHEVVHVAFNMPVLPAADEFYAELTLQYAEMVDFAAIRFSYNVASQPANLADAIVIKDKGTQFSFKMHDQGKDLNHFETAKVNQARVLGIDIWCPSRTSLSQVKLALLLLNDDYDGIATARPGYSADGVRQSTVFLTIILMAGFSLLFLSLLLFAIVFARRILRRGSYSVNACRRSAASSSAPTPVSSSSSSSQRLPYAAVPASVEAQTRARSTFDADMLAADEAALNAAIELSKADMKAMPSKRLSADVVVYSDDDEIPPLIAPSDYDEPRASPVYPGQVFIPLRAFPGPPLHNVVKK
jgi:hypothetical protein